MIGLAAKHNGVEVISHRTFLSLSTAVIPLVCAISGARPVSAQSVTSTGIITPGAVQTPTWIVGAPLVVGDGSDGTLVIADGGSVSNTSGTIGNNAIGTVTVTGSAAAPSTWTSTDDLLVGDTGTGTLTIQNGGAVDVGGTSYVANNAGSQGTVTVSGQDSGGHAATWASGGDLVIGQFGTGSLTISDGGAVDNATGYIGASAGSVGAVIVSGQGSNGVASTWTNSGDLRVGEEGTGELTVQGGGAVTVNGDLAVGGFGGTGVVMLESAGQLLSSTGTIGSDTSGDGQVLVTGSGTAWDTTGRITVGGFGTGTLRIEDGAQVSSNDGIVGSAAHGDVVVTGPGTSWINTQQLNVGSFGTGTLRIDDGASVVSDQGYIGANNTGSVVVTGPGSNWTVTTYSMTVGNDGDGTLTVEDGGRVRAEGGFALGMGAAASGTVILQGTAGNHAVLETSQIRAGQGAVSFTVDGGMLRATRDEGSFFVDFDVHDITLGSNGGVIDTDGHDIGISPRFVGAGSLIKDGAGALILTGDNIYTGGTTIAAGTLQLGDGGTTGSILGDVADNGTLAFNRADAVTFAGAISGSGGVRQIGTGTTILTATNSYIGGTAIEGGTLQISSDANLGDAAGGLTFSAGTLNTTANVTSSRNIIFAGAGTLATNAGTTLTLNGMLSGTGAFAKTGAGIIVLTGNSGGYVGAAQVDAGTLTVNGVLSGSLAVNTAGRLEGLGRVGSVANGGIVAPGFGGTMGTLTIQGDYAGNGGRLEITAVLGDDGSQTSRLAVNGATSGTTQVNVINRGGLGAQTVEGIKIVDVTGASSGRFVLNGDYVFHGEPAVIAGAYGYRLYQGGVSSPADGDWYLRSALLDPGQPNDDGGETNPLPLYQPGVPVYEVYAANLQLLNTLPTLQQRVGNRSWTAGAMPEGSGVWGRIEGMRNRAKAALSTSQADQTVNEWKMQLGADRVLAGTHGGARLVAGINAYYGQASSQIRSPFGDGSLKTDGYGVGATLTWYGLDGFYTDGQVQLSWYDSDLASHVVGSLVDGNKGKGEALSLELGKRTPISGKLSITPQMQMIYSNVSFDRFVDPVGGIIEADKGDSLKSRWGLSLDRQNQWDGGRSHVYGLFNLSYEWLEGARTLVSSTPIERREGQTWGEVGLGASVNWKKLMLYGEASGSSPFRDFGGSYVLKGNIGLRLQL